MLAGVSTRKFAGVGEPVGERGRAGVSSSTSKTSVSEMFIERTRTALGELMSRRLDDVRLAVMMLDGLEIAERTHVVALGITTEGVKIPLGLWEGSTENATLARDAARRPRRPRPRSRAGDPVRHRRRRPNARPSRMLARAVVLQPRWTLRGATVRGGSQARGAPAW